MKKDDKFPTSKEFQNLFTNSQNKIRLQLFLKEEFVILAQEHKNIRFIYSLRRNCWDSSSEKGCSEVDEFKCSHIEADSILLFIYSQLRQSDKTTVVVIDAEDTDVVVLCAHVAHTIEGVLGLKRKKVFQIARNCALQIWQVLLFHYTFILGQTLCQVSTDVGKKLFLDLLLGALRYVIC